MNALASAWEAFKTGYRRARLMAEQRRLQERADDLYVEMWKAERRLAEAKRTRDALRARLKARAP